MRQPRHWDPFRLLSILSIVLGMIILIAATALTYLTHFESPEVFGAGLILTTGGGFRAAIEWMVRRLPEYEPAPRELPDPKAHARREHRDED